MRAALRENVVVGLRGGLVFAALSIGIVLPLAQLAFAALGHAALPYAIRVTLVSAIVGNLVTPIVGGVAFANGLPRTSTTLIYAGLLAALVHTGTAAGVGTDAAVATATSVRPGDVLLLASTCVALSGLIQIAFAALRVGSLVRYVPVPVVSGFVNGLALLILLTQIGPLAGLSAGPGRLWERRGEVQPGAVLLGIATAALVYWIGRRRPRWPAALIAIGAGTLFYMLANRFVPNLALGSVMGAPDAVFPRPEALVGLLGDRSAALLRQHAALIGVTALVIALIGSLDALLAAAATENAIKLGFAPNRMLVGFGLASIVSGAFGGLPPLYSGSLVVGAYGLGGARTVRKHAALTYGRWCGPVSAMLMLLLLMFGAPVLGAIPLTVGAGVMVVIGFSLFDDWSPRLFTQLVRRRATRDVLASLAIVIIVCVATVLLGFVVGVVVGMALALIMFVLALNRSLIRSATTAVTRTSRRFYPLDQAAAIRAHAERVHILTLEGALFFGTAEKLRLAIDALAREGVTVIVDVGSITAIDASAAMMLERTAHRLADVRAHLLIAGVSPGTRHAHVLHAFAPSIHPSDWSHDLDHALERVEWVALRDAGLLRSDLEMPLEQTPILEGLSAVDREQVIAAMTRHEYAAGDLLFRRGDPGDDVYTLARGTVRLIEGLGEDRTRGRRIVSVQAGVVFGEVALVDNGPRSATAIAEAPAVVYALPRSTLERWRIEQPALAATVLLAVARQLSGRLRFANTVLWRREAERVG